jgi:AcrR family transcriptional regulator
LRSVEFKSGSARRPADRKAQIAAAASALFRERGFHGVSVADIAAVVGITAPAVYKHFHSKHELLGYAVRDALDVLGSLSQDARDIDGLLQQLAAYHFERRGLGALWQREVRHLPAEQREALRRRFLSIAERCAVLIQAARPVPPADAELLARAVLGVFGSLSWHRITLPRRRFEDLVCRLTAAVAYCQLGDPVWEPSLPDGSGAIGARLTVPRREQLLTEAIRLFDERGFHSVTTDDIGAAAGVSGPSIYRHYPAKTDLLVAAVERGSQRRQASSAHALARADEPHEALKLLLRAYIDFALDNSHLLGVLISELDHLPEQRRKHNLQMERDFLALWGQLLHQAAPGSDRAEQKVVIQAVLTVVDNVARSRRLAARADIADRLAEIGNAVLLGRWDADPRQAELLAGPTPVVKDKVNLQ